MLEIEILETNLIEGGVEVFARAFNDAGQIGFGKDGSVDIERFRIFNPPVLVPDPVGDIVREEYDEKIDANVFDFLREDPEEALLQTLEHTIKTVGKSGDNIIAGKIGNTTSTFYTTSGDGEVRNQDTGWSTTHDAVTGTLALPVNTRQIVGSYINGTTFIIYRAFLPFDTSAINDSDVIDSAVLSIYPSDIWDNDNDGDDFIVAVDTTQPSTTTLTTADFDLCGDAVSNPTEGSNQRDFTGMSTGSYNNFTLDAVGRGWISKTGVSKLGLREGHDVKNSAVNVTGDTAVRFYTSEEAGTTRDPKLVVEHSVGAVSQPARQGAVMMM